jgi:octanoyl-[GcvH]:protein N-octanoyltransferase
MSSDESIPPEHAVAATCGWLVEAPQDPVEVGDQLARELLELENAATADGPPRAFLWFGKQSLVASGSDVRSPRFHAAAAASAQTGWPVHVRSSGGTAVALTPGILNVALIRPWIRRRLALEAGFQMICALLVDAFADLDVAAGTGSVPAAYCDGRFNVLVGSRKIAGTSQRQANRGERGASLIHATILIDADLPAITRAVNFFYERAGIAREHRAEAIVNLVDCVPVARARALRQVLTNKLKEPLRFGGGEAQGVPETNAAAQHPWE